MILAVLMLPRELVLMPSRGGTGFLSWRGTTPKGGIPMILNAHAVIHILAQRAPHPIAHFLALISLFLRKTFGNSYHLILQTTKRRFREVT